MAVKGFSLFKPKAQDLRPKAIKVIRSTGVILLQPAGAIGFRRGSLYILGCKAVGYGGNTPF